MLRNYLLVAFRALRKQPGYTALNVGGLGLGLACCFLIVLFVQHERAFDRFHEHGERLYRLTYVNDQGQQYANTAAGFAPILEGEFSEVERAIRIEEGRAPYLRRADGQVFRVENTSLADDGFFGVFGFELLRGAPETVLADRFSIVLTETVAQALFGEADPVGQVLRFNDRWDVTVTGVAADPPAASSIRFAAVLPFGFMTEFAGPGALEDFTNFNYMTYVLLRPGARPGAVEERLVEALRRPFGEETTFTARLQPLADIHFDTSLTYDYPTVREPRTLVVFGALALLILLIACVNFTNLATARAMRRAREVGVRKTLGAFRGQIAGQFLSESVLLGLAATALGLGLTALLAPAFREAIDTTAALDPAQPGLMALLLGIGVAAGVLAGSYPAFYLAAFDPARVLKGDARRGGGTPVLRRGLIAFQFAAGIFLLVATITVYQQLRYMQERDLGFEREHVVFLQPPPPLWPQYEAFRDGLLADARVAQVARGSLPGRTFTNRGYNWPGQDGDEQGEGFWTVIADPHYLDALGIELAAGRTFRPDTPADQEDAYLLNEAAARLLGWTPEEALGQPFRAWDRPTGEVVGVVRDYHFQSLHARIEPVVINYKPDWLPNVVVRLAPGDVASGLAAVRAQWEALAPGYAFEYRFLDEDFGRLYETEQRLGRLFGLFAGVAVFIACLGLFGMAAFTAEQRRKEIGVRKVLGAGVPSIVGLLSKDFGVLVLVGMALAVAPAYFLMSRWLDGFAYRTALGPEVFVAAGLVALTIALLTVAGQALRAATADPVEALRAE